MQTGITIGITGHQSREGLDWQWTRGAMEDVLRDVAPVRQALSSLAIGADQVFAELALANAISLRVIVPFADYERCFSGEGLKSYRDLLARSHEVVVLAPTTSDQHAFLAAGLAIADACDLLVAVWDGKPAAGLGGTADIVRHALNSCRRVAHLDPFSRVVRILRE